MKLKKLQEDRAILQKKMQDAVALAESEDRNLTDDELKIIEEGEGEIKDIDRQIKAIRTQQRLASTRSAPPATIPGPPPGTEGEDREKRELADNFRLVRAVDLILKRKALDGAEAEAFQVATEEFREVNANATGSIRIPTFIADPYAEERQRKLAEQRATLVAATPATLGNTIEKTLGQFIEPLRPTLGVEMMGATTLTGLQGNISMPRQTGIGEAYWAGETEAAQETNPTTDLPEMAPHRLTAKESYSQQLFLQSSISVENLVRRDLAFAVRNKVDRTAYNGSGSGNTPLGILNYTGIGVHPGDTNGKQPDRTVLLQIIKELMIDNADTGNLGWLTTPGIMVTLMNTKLDEGSGRFVWNEATPNQLMGYRAATTNNMPSDLSKGTANDLHAIIFGNWSAFMIGQWGGVDIMVDPYTQLDEAKVRLVVNSFWDFQLRHEQFFAASKDAISL